MTVPTVCCVLCGGRGGWWSWPGGARDPGDGFRETCPRCEGTGWEPSETVRSIIGGVA